LTRYFFK